VLKGGRLARATSARYGHWSMSPWRQLPKVELHTHLDGALSYQAAALLQPGLSPETYRERFVAPSRCRDLLELLTPFTHALALEQSEQGLRVATRDLVAQLAADQVLYAEVRFAPLLHLEGGLSPGAVVDIVSDELLQRSRESDLEARLLLCTVRHFTREQSLETARLVLEKAAGGVVAGLDLAGDEAGHPLDPHVEAFARVRAAGLPCTAHAGEAAGPASVGETIDRLRPVRVGHGVRAIEDPAMVSRLRERGIHLEICPSSNVQIGLYPSVSAHPLAALRQQGVSVGVNTDGRAVARITLTLEYERIAEAFGWSAADFAACNQAALHAAFAPTEVKARIGARLAPS
jgi:adenosine deaminase